MITRYRKMLENWIASQRDYVGFPHDRDDLAFYGTGTNIWGIQTHMKGFSAYAVIAADDEADHAACGTAIARII